MKVKELIEELKKVDPEATVLVPGGFIEELTEDFEVEVTPGNVFING